MKSTNSRLVTMRRFALVAVIAIAVSAGAALGGEAVKFSKVRTIKGPDSYISSIAFIGNGADIAVAFSDDSVTVWNVASGKVRKRICDQHPGDVGFIFVAADLNGQFGTLSGGEDESLLIWDANRLTRKTDWLRGFSVHSRDLVFSPVGNEVVTVGGSAESNREFGEILVWDLTEGTPKTFYTGDHGLNLGGRVARW